MKVFQFLAAAAVTFSPVAAASDNNILFILDSSNSMWGQIDGTAKMEIAKSALNGLLQDLSEDVQPGLMLYGHRDKSNCQDVELVAPFGAASAAAMKQAVALATPKGKTPIATALAQALNAFDGRLEDNNSILLISDGIETCEGDPCAVAAQLLERQIDLRVNVIGFDVDAAARAQLQCIAEKGNGQYFDANDAGGLKEAVEEARDVAVAPPPPPPPPVPEPEPEPEPKQPVLYFEDEFDGDDLGPHWQLANPNPDTYLVENGVLISVSRDGLAANEAEGQNVLRLDKPIPKGDWQITARFTMTPQTMGEEISLGLSKDAENGLLASFAFESYNYSRTDVQLRSNKLTGGEAAGFSRNLMSIEDRNIPLRSDQFAARVAAIELRLEKAGRNYTGAVRLEPTDAGRSAGLSDDWLTVQQLTSLRAPGTAFTLISGSRSNGYTPADGEGVIELDWIRIEQP